jgi:hypothetical protein
MTGDERLSIGGRRRINRKKGGYPADRIEPTGLPDEPENAKRRDLYRYAIASGTIELDISMELYCA